MSRHRPRYPSRRGPQPLERQPWTPDDDAKLIDMVRIGLCVDYYGPSFPDRRFGDILERRLELREAGIVRKPAPL
jgi:hypothetical protein